MRRLQGALVIAVVAFVACSSASGAGRAVQQGSSTAGVPNTAPAVVPFSTRSLLSAKQLLAAAAKDVASVGASWGSREMPRPRDLSRGAPSGRPSGPVYGYTNMDYGGAAGGRMNQPIADPAAWGRGGGMGGGLANGGGQSGYGGYANPYGG